MKRLLLRSSLRSWINLIPALKITFSFNFKLTIPLTRCFLVFCRSISITKNHWNKRNRRLNSTNIYLLKVNNRNTRKRCELYSKLTIKTPERRHWRRIVNVNFEHISVFSSAFIFDFEKVNISWKRVYLAVAMTFYKIILPFMV